MSGRNRQWTAKNPFQRDVERVLCVCSAGILRAPTVAGHLYTQGYNTRAVGIESSHALIPLDDVLLEWADAVVVMDYTQAELVFRKNYKGPIYNLGLEDCYDFNDPALLSFLERHFATLNEKYRWDD